MKCLETKKYVFTTGEESDEERKVIEIATRIRSKQYKVSESTNLVLNVPDLDGNFSKKRNLLHDDKEGEESSSEEEDIHFISPANQTKKRQKLRQSDHSVRIPILEQNRPQPSCSSDTLYQIKNMSRSSTENTNNTNKGNKVL